MYFCSLFNRRIMQKKPQTHTTIPKKKAIVVLNPPYVRHNSAVHLGLVFDKGVDFVVGKKKKGGKNASGMHGVKKVKLNNMKRKFF